MSNILGEDRWHGGKRPTLLKKEKERDRSGPYANSGQRRVTKTFTAKFLVPTAAKPKRGEIEQNCQGSDTLDDKSAQAVANMISSEPGENLMRAVEKSCNDCVPKPRCHIAKQSNKCASDEILGCTSAFRPSW